MWYHITRSLVPSISRCCHKILGIHHAVTWCHTDTWSTLLQKPKIMNVLCRIIPNNCRYVDGVLHSANYIATLTELCKHFNVDMHFCTPSDNFSQLTCMLLHSDLIWTSVDCAYAMVYDFAPFASHNSYPSPPRWCVDNPRLYSVLNLELLVDFS